MDEANDTTEVESQPEAKGLRAQVEALSKENREYKVKERDGIISGLGLETTTGLGLALVEQFDRGDLALADIAQTATDKYGHVVQATAEPAHPQAQAITEGTARLEAVGQTAGSVMNPTADDLLRKAEVEGDYRTTMAIKSQQVADMFNS
jgi:hypothetical protein